MAGKSTALLGIYPNYSGVMSAVNVLKGAGFRKTEMRIGALTIPGLDSFAVAGSVWSVFAASGAREGGAGGGITDPLIGMGISEHEARRYELRVEEGGILLSVHSDKSGWTFWRGRERRISRQPKRPAPTGVPSARPHASRLRRGASSPTRIRRSRFLFRAVRLIKRRRWDPTGIRFRNLFRARGHNELTDSIFHIPRNQRVGAENPHRGCGL